MILKPPSARGIGLFVVGALALTVTGLIAFGATSYFEHRPRAVTFFHGSVAGLAAGAPVTFRGVPVGKVVDIALQINSATGAAHIPVIMEFEPGRITVTGDTGGNAGISKSLLAPRSPLLADIQTLVRNLATASGALRSFADQIERNPNALFMGRSQR